MTPEQRIELSGAIRRITAAFVWASERRQRWGRLKILYRPTPRGGMVEFRWCWRGEDVWHCCDFSAAQLLKLGDEAMKATAVNALDAFASAELKR